MHVPVVTEKYLPINTNFSQHAQSGQSWPIHRGRPHRDASLGTACRHALPHAAILGCVQASVLWRVRVRHLRRDDILSAQGNGFIKPRRRIIRQPHLGPPISASAARSLVRDGFTYAFGPFSAHRHENRSDMRLSPSLLRGKPGTKWCVFPQTACARYIHMCNTVAQHTRRLHALAW